MCMGSGTGGNFVEQTRRSLNPIHNVKNFTQPAVALHEAEGGLSPTPPGAQPAIQAAYAPDTNSVLRQRKTAVNTGAFSSLLPAGPSVSSGSSLLGG